eukprot:CAMPEP_0202863450 /NCGR_PEP_ID=MMETSP1391-20130828/4082_1 /ASSEMBLY_ACC=CAM_ASM_000867 /TAXON_ID=1034604 /ORGANISM="Chlamydomonas leiostraca, Strain SAG 11-49" /LENGTH=104 /DNA_ID=CAMNT_0049543091 /DNA_START=62 /DNA_END=376 /DNA_ORIENTATION=+
MSASLVRSTPASVASGRTQRSVARPAVRGTSARLPVRRTVAPAPSTSSVSKVATQVAGMEVAQIAGEAGFIAGTAFTMCAITLVGLAFGFILLRVESLAEEGKL